MSNIESQKNVTSCVSHNNCNSGLYVPPTAASSSSIKLTNEAITLAESFFIDNNGRRKLNLKIEVQLNAHGIYMQGESIEQKQITKEWIHIEDIVGSSCSSCLLKSSRRVLKSCKHLNELNEEQSLNISSSANENRDVSAYLYIYAYVRQERPLRRLRTVRLLRFGSFNCYEDNLKCAERWHQAIKVNKQLSLGMLEGERKPLLILLNPKSGSGKGRRMFHKHIVPVLEEAEIPYELIITSYANYARELIQQSENLKQSYGGIVVASGDGLFHEVLNGLMGHKQWRNLTHCMPLGVIPCGSGNGLAKTIAHHYGEPYESNPILNSTLACVSGKTDLLDIMRVELAKSDKALYSFLSIGWGLIADIDIESEILRSFGSQRFTLWSVHRLMHLRIYKGKLSYLPWCPQGMEAVPNLADVLASNNETSETFHYIQEEDDDNLFYDVMLDDDDQSSYKSNKDSWQSRRTAYYSLAGQSIRSQRSIPIRKYDGASEDLDVTCPKSFLPPLNSPVPDTWHSEQGEYIMVHAACTTHLSADCFFAPDSKLNDGIIYLIIIRAGIARYQLLNFLLNVSSGTHLSVSSTQHIEVVPVTAFRLEPQDTDGIIAVDGERVQYGALQAEVLPGLVQVMVPNVPPPSTTGTTHKNM